MASEQDAHAAFERWRAKGTYPGFGDFEGEGYEEQGFLAGYEAGHQDLRDRILKIIHSAESGVNAVKSAFLAALGN